MLSAARQLRRLPSTVSDWLGPLLALGLTASGLGESNEARRRPVAAICGGLKKLGAEAWLFQVELLS